jgi:hypothetical protein
MFNSEFSYANELVFPESYSALTSHAFADRGHQQKQAPMPPRVSAANLFTNKRQKLSARWKTLSHKRLMTTMSCFIFL